MHAFPDLSLPQKSSNGVIWYILGANTVLIAFPLDIAVVSILMYVHPYYSILSLFIPLNSLSWADTAASTFGRLWGSLTPPLPARLLGLPLAPRKSLAGFIAATVTGAAVAAGFWTYVAPIRDTLTWSWDLGVSSTFSGTSMEGGGVFSGFTGLAVVAVYAGLVSGVAEALGECLLSDLGVCSLWNADLGSVDDNLSLPIIAGSCLWGLFKVLGWLGSVLP
jgi:diacylglycerol kinase (CTP)